LRQTWEYHGKSAAPEVVRPRDRRVVRQIRADDHESGRDRKAAAISAIARRLPNWILVMISPGVGLRSNLEAISKKTLWPNIGGVGVRVSNLRNTRICLLRGGSYAVGSKSEPACILDQNPAFKIAFEIITRVVVTRAASTILHEEAGRYRKPSKMALKLKHTCSSGRLALLTFSIITCVEAVPPFPGKGPRQVSITLISLGNW
jgi:hypothetical protein